MLELIEDQPNPCILYESYFELDKRSLLTYLIQFQKVYDELLSEKNYQYFDEKYPLFYPNKDGRSVIDMGLEYNVVRPITDTIDYLVKF